MLAGRQVLAQQMLERHQPHEDHEACPYDPPHRRRVPASRRCAARPGAAATPAGRRGSGRECYGVVVDSVNVSVFEYAPVRSASLAPIGCLNAMSTRSFDVGPVHVDFENATCSGCGRVNAPLARYAG